MRCGCAHTYAQIRNSGHCTRVRDLGLCASTKQVSSWTPTNPSFSLFPATTHLRHPTSVARDSTLPDLNQYGNCLKGIHYNVDTVQPFMRARFIWLVFSLWTPVLHLPPRRCMPQLTIPKILNHTSPQYRLIKCWPTSAFYHSRINVMSSASL
jgi:hypothetical protein